MKKSKKSRVSFASYNLYSGTAGVYFLLVPYDKRGREIPSSVNCAYNSAYYGEDQILQMTRSL